MISFEIARRHRFHRDIRVRDEDVSVHVLPTGRTPGRFNDWSKLRYNDRRAVQQTIAIAEEATLAFLEDSALP